MKPSFHRLQLTVTPFALAVVAFFFTSGAAFVPAASAQASAITAKPSAENSDGAGAKGQDEETTESKPLVRRSNSERVQVGSRQVIEADEIVPEVVTVFGSCEMAGTANRDMVTVFGGSTMTGKIGHDMVTVFGNSKSEGPIGHDSVTVFGDAEINGPVGHDVVVVFGSLKLGSNAVVNHDCVAVFGRIQKHPQAILTHGSSQFMPIVADLVSSLTNYIRSGPLLLRPLPPGSGLAWMFVSFFFLLYFLVALILPKPAAACVRQLDTRPLLCFGLGVLLMIVLAPLYFILALSGVGFVLVPFLWMVEIAFVILGKASALQFFGLQIQRRFSSTANSRPLVAFVTGFIFLTVIYMVPVIGGLAWLAFRPLALGTTFMSVLASFKRSGNGGAKTTASAPVQPVSTGIGAVPSPAAGSEPPSPSATIPEPTGATSFAAPTSPPRIEPLPTQPIGATPMLRAGFWIRVAATALDFVLLVWLLVIPFVQVIFPFLWLAYFIAMWTWRGTTIGGIVCRIKVVRADGRPVDFPVALVRGLASVFSTMALFIGFFWAGWTNERRSWHDLISGTAVVHVPPNVPML